MTRQTDMAVPPMAPDESFHIRHHGGVRMQVSFVGFDSRKKRGICRGDLSGEYEFWLHTEGKHERGRFCMKALRWWHVDPGTLERVLAAVPAMELP
ncbi:MAG: hypothetical protein V3W41_21870 [Planctomycetota bacterium]